jgi:hypothetical protein
MIGLKSSQAALKPLDLYVLLYVASHPQRMTYAQLGGALLISASQGHMSLRRANAARLLSLSEAEGPLINRAALREFLIHGAKYAFPAVLGAPTRGIPTGYAAPPLRDEFAQAGEAPPVWPYAAGEVRGIALYPLHSSAPKVAVSDPPFYELLALFDAVRAGAARERERAAELLARRL